MPSTSADSLGPFAYEIWKRWKESPLEQSACEIPLYTDAHVTGEETGTGLNLGPYQLINTVPSDRRFGLLRSAVIIRLLDPRSGQFELPDLSATDDSRYHGGDWSDEIAALLSLCLGLRFRPGAITRTYYPHQDPRGRPVHESLRDRPILLTYDLAPRIPSAMGPRGLHEATLLPTFPDLSPQEATALVRAARLYQQALWISDTDPELAWLLFVSATEVAADRWFTGQLDNITIFRQQKPDLAKRLHNMAGDEAVKAVADEFSPVMRATYKFNQFTLEFMPDPPISRPHESAQLDWSPSRLKVAVAAVYKHRSRALHGGTPFPLPMCEVPFRHHEWSAPAEIPVATAAASAGGCVGARRHSYAASHLRAYTPE